MKSNAATATADTSILSSEPDGMGYFYGRVPDDPRQINVRSYDEPRLFGLVTRKLWIALVGDTEVGHKFRSKEAAEQAAIRWLRDNPPQDIPDSEGNIAGVFYPGGVGVKRNEDHEADVDIVRVTPVDPVTLKPIGPHNPDLVPGAAEAEVRVTEGGNDGSKA